MLNVQNFCGGMNKMLGAGSTLITMLKGSEYLLKNSGNEQAKKVADYIKERRILIAMCRLGAFVRLFQTLNLPAIANANGLDVAVQRYLGVMKYAVPFSVAGFGYIVPQVNSLIADKKGARGNVIDPAVISVSEKNKERWATAQDWGSGVVGNTMAASWFLAMTYLEFRADVTSLVSASYNLIDFAKYAGEGLGAGALLMQKRAERNNEADAAGFWKSAGNRVKSVRVLAMVKPGHKCFFGA